MSRKPGAVLEDVTKALRDLEARVAEIERNTRPRRQARVWGDRIVEIMDLFFKRRKP